MTVCTGPFYASSEIQEDHGMNAAYTQYAGCIRIPGSWSVPNNNFDSAWLAVPGLVDALIGCCLWNPTYGYFTITYFDQQLQRIKIRRVDVVGTAAVGAVIPECTKFVITALPSSFVDRGSIYISNSWYVPDVGLGVSVTVPGVTGIIPGTYLWNPSYGYFWISIVFAGTNPQTLELEKSNDAVVGTFVPPNTQFIITATPP